MYSYKIFPRDTLILTLILYYIIYGTCIVLSLLWMDAHHWFRYRIWYICCFLSLCMFMYIAYIKGGLHRNEEEQHIKMASGTKLVSLNFEIFGLVQGMLQLPLHVIACPKVFGFLCDFYAFSQCLLTPLTSLTL